MMGGEPPFVDESSLEDVRVLGKGDFGFVSLKRDSNFRYYAKKSSSMDFKENIEKELRIMLRFRNHPRIVQAASPRLHFGIEPEDNCYIYMEYASEGTLGNMISKFHRRPMPEYLIQHAVRMILQGLDALHSHGYVHCDLKPSNVLVFPSTTVGEPWDLKLTDFGSSKEPNSYNGLLYGSKLLCTPQYMSPEYLGPKRLIDPALDIWSLGCIVYEMFGGMAVQEIFEDSYEWTMFNEISPVANDFLSQCHALHPSRRCPESELLNQPLRPTAAELLQHPFVTQSIIPLPTAREEEDLPMVPRIPSSYHQSTAEENKI